MSNLSKLKTSSVLSQVFQEIPPAPLDQEHHFPDLGNIPHRFPIVSSILSNKKNPLRYLGQLKGKFPILYKILIIAIVIIVMGTLGIVNPLMLLAPLGIL